MILWSTFSPRLTLKFQNQQLTVLLFNNSRSWKKKRKETKHVSPGRRRSGLWSSPEAWNPRYVARLARRLSLLQFPSFPLFSCLVAVLHANRRLEIKVPFPASAPSSRSLIRQSQRLSLSQIQNCCCSFQSQSKLSVQNFNSPFFSLKNFRRVSRTGLIDFCFVFLRFAIARWWCVLHSRGWRSTTRRGRSWGNH